MRQTVTPYLLYEDADAALAWVAKTFGFGEKDRIAGPDGKVAHAETDVGDGSSVFLGAHCARARGAGAEITEEPSDQPYGDRRYAAEDPEGHLWYFATPLQ
jgi:uncharacterized glyoxalase superfamily protein PhnB